MMLPRCTSAGRNVSPWHFVFLAFSFQLFIYIIYFFGWVQEMEGLPPGVPLPPFETGLSCYSAEFSPFEDNKIAVACSQHFGIIGAARPPLQRRKSDLPRTSGGAVSWI
jgi:hypothetical protein